MLCISYESGIHFTSMWPFGKVGQISSMLDPPERENLISIFRVLSFQEYGDLSSSTKLEWYPSRYLDFFKRNIFITPALL